MFFKFLSKAADRWKCSLGLRYQKKTSPSIKPTMYSKQKWVYSLMHAYIQIYSHYSHHIYHFQLFALKGFRQHGKVWPGAGAGKILWKKQLCFLWCRAVYTNTCLELKCLQIYIHTYLSLQITVYCKSNKDLEVVKINVLSKSVIVQYIKYRHSEMYRK